MIDETEKDALFPNGKTTDSTNSDDFISCWRNLFGKKQLI